MTTREKFLAEAAITLLALPDLTAHQQTTQDTISPETLDGYTTSIVDLVYHEPRTAQEQTLGQFDKVRLSLNDGRTVIIQSVDLTGNPLPLTAHQQ